MTRLGGVVGRGERYLPGVKVCQLILAKLASPPCCLAYIQPDTYITYICKLSFLFYTPIIFLSHSSQCCTMVTLYFRGLFLCLSPYGVLAYRHTVLKPNLWMDNFVEVSGHNLDSCQTWDFLIQCFHYKPVSKGVGGGGGRESVCRGDCE